MEQNRKRQPNGIESVRLGWISLMPIIMGRPWAKNRQRAWLLRVRARTQASKSTVTSSWYVRLQIRVLRQAAIVARRWRGGGAAVARVVRARLLCSHGPSSIQDKFSSHHHHITCAFNGPTHFPRSLLKSLLATFFSFYLYVFPCLPSLIYIIKMLVSKFCVAGLSFWRQISNMCHKREIVHILNGKKGRKQQL